MSLLSSFVTSLTGNRFKQYKNGHYAPTAETIADFPAADPASADVTEDFVYLVEIRAGVLFDTDFGPHPAAIGTYVTRSLDRTHTLSVPLEPTTESTLEFATDPPRTATRPHIEGEPLTDTTVKEDYARILTQAHGIATETTGTTSTGVRSQPTTPQD